MRRIAIAFLLVSIGTSSIAQWKKIADFIGTDGTVTFGEYITCIYFINLPGSPRVGFVGTQSELYKTTNGGLIWHSVWDSGWYVTDIYFKDSLIGWFTILGDTAACYRTTDGGETWKGLNVPGICEGVYYSDSSHRLLLISDTLIRISTDLGDTWPDSLPYYAAFPFSFSSPSHGILSVNFYPDTTEGFIITSDGGVTWDTIHSTLGGEILTIPGTSTCYVTGGDWVATIFRSDDYGHTWRQVGHLPDTLLYYTGIIKGDFSRLSVQSDSGMYVSVDSGVTWNFDGGPTYITNFSNDEFYSANGVTFAGMTYSNGIDEDGGLWEEIWPQSGVAENEDTNSGSISVFPNPAAFEIQILAGPVGTVHLFDIMGRERMTANDDGTGATLDVSHLEDGTYFLRLGNQSTKVEIAR